MVDAVDVLGWLRDRERLAQDAGGLLSAAEIDELAESFGPDDVSVEDVPLLDELRYLLGEQPDPEPSDDPLEDLYDDLVPEVSTLDQRRASITDRPTASVDDDGYAHVLVDEAQDLSPMQWRMLGRRGRHASWTIVGDAAQSSWPLPVEAALRLARKRSERSPRTSSTCRPTTATPPRSSSWPPTWPAPLFPAPIYRSRSAEPESTRECTTSSPPDLPAAVREITASAVERVDGTVGVVVPDGWRSRVESWIGARDDVRVPVLEALDTKGLEFDAIVVVEPDRIAVGLRGGHPYAVRRPHAGDATARHRGHEPPMAALSAANRPSRPCPTLDPSRPLLRRVQP